MEILITQAHLDAARKSGACGEGIAEYKPGMPLSSVRTDHLNWIAEVLPSLAAEAEGLASQSLLRGRLPLMALGYGDGCGDGYGYVLGCGGGYGYGDGKGKGKGYGYGDGDGYGIPRGNERPQPGASGET